MQEKFYLVFLTNGHVSTIISGPYDTAAQCDAAKTAYIAAHPGTSPVCWQNQDLN